jgi:hypothetical protein
MTDQQQLPAELPLETDYAQAKKHLYQLAELTTDKIIQRPFAVVPPEAVDFLGRERAAMNEKILVITQMGFQMQKVIRDADENNSPIDTSPVIPEGGIEDQNPHLKSLNTTIKSLVSSTADDVSKVTSMSVISRLWKYLAVESKIPFDMKRNFLSPVEFRMNLERYAREHNLPPWTQSEEYDLFSAIKQWKKGDSTESILKHLGYSIDAAAHRASFPTRASREYARNRGIDRVALGYSVQRLREIKAFLEELFKQERPQVR